MLRLRHAAQQPSLTLAGVQAWPRRPLARPLGLAILLLAVLLAAAVLRVVSGSVVAASGGAPAPLAAGTVPAAAVVASAPSASAGPASSAPAPSAAPEASGAPASAVPAPSAGSSVGPAGPVPNAVSAPVAAAPSASPSATPQPTPVATPPVLTPQLSATLTQRLATLRSQLAIPGVQAAIIFPDGHSWRAHSGFQDYGARVPVQNQTPFPVASVTKTFIAALVVQLAQEGRLGLDDRLVRYLPGANVDPRVTIRELLDHTSGTYDFFSNSDIDTALLGCRSCAWTPERALSYVKKPLFAPGTRWSYSNTGYVLLGQLVERVTGQSYASLLRARFFAPLGLISTYVQGEEPAPYPVVHSYRFFTSSRGEKPTSLWDGTGISPFRSLATAAGSAGDIASSARDLAVWARALYGGRELGVDGSRAMLDFTATDLVHAPVPYGLGVEEFTVAGRQAYGHGGRLLGARSAIRYLPAEGVAIAVVINTDRGNPATIVDALASTFLTPPPPATTTP